MVNVHPSSLIGAQAYAAQLRRQYGQEETTRAFNPDSGSGGRADRQTRRAAVEADARPEQGVRRPAGASAAIAGARAFENPAIRENPTIGPAGGDAPPRPNPPARPLFSSAAREAPNPNAQLRNVRPGTHLDITI